MGVGHDVTATTKTPQGESLSWHNSGHDAWRPSQSEFLLSSVGFNQREIAQARTLIFDVDGTLAEPMAFIALLSMRHSGNPVSPGIGTAGVTGRKERNPGVCPRTVLEKAADASDSHAFA